MLKREFLSLAAMGATMLAAPAWAQKSQNMLRWASIQSITAVDPYYNAHREAIILNGQLVWDTLVYRDPESADYVPLLAKSWQWKDNVTIEFVLRDDVKFHDGIGLTAEDAVYTLNYVSNPDNKINVQSNVNWIKSAETTGPYSFIVHLKAPFPPALEYFASLLAILPKDFYGAGGVAGGNGRLVGTGPYRLTAFAPGASIDVERFNGYFGGSPKGQPTIQKIRYRTIPDPSTQMAELLSGGLDWIWYVPPDQAVRLKALRRLTVRADETMRISFLSFNMRDMAGNNPVKDIRVRRAIAHAIDRETIVKHIIGEGSSLVKAPCFRTQFGCSQDVSQIAYDPAAAKRLLAEAGYAAGLTLDLVAFRSREWTEAVAGFMNAVGIKTNIIFLQYAAMRDRVVNNSVHLQLGDWGSYSINDASAILNNYFTLSADDMARDSQVADWLNKASGTVDSAARLANYQQAVSRISDQLYWLPLWVHPVTYAHSADLDFKSFPDENPRFFLSRWKS